MAEQTTERGVHEPSVWRLSWRRARQQALYLAVTATVVALAALALAAGAAAVQAGRDEARVADLALVVAPAVPPVALADHAFELYRRGYAPVMVLTGEGHAGLKAQLVERGVPESSVLSGAAAAGAADLQRLAREARAGGATSLLVVTDAVETLRVLKIARDQGLRAYGAPLPSGAPDPVSLAMASVHYWRYVLLGL